MSPFTLRQTPQPIQWAALLGASVVCVAAFELMRLPAALMLGAIGAAILLCWFEGRVTIPPWGFVIAQGFIGCLVARAITADIVVTMGCGDECPYIRGKRYIDWHLPDPKGRPLDEVRAIRDDIGRRVRELIDELHQPPSA